MSFTENETAIVREIAFLLKNAGQDTTHLDSLIAPAAAPVGKTLEEQYAEEAVLRAAKDAGAVVPIKK